MNTKEKSIKFVELMFWTLKVEHGKDCVITPSLSTMGVLEPYSDTTQGLAQFAAILLKFPEVMNRFVLIKDGWHRHAKGPKGGDIYIQCKPTQANILDEILRINGIEL